jgi:HSF-type DNA-binding
MLLRHSTASSQLLMEKSSPMLLGPSRVLYGHIDEYLLSMKGKRSSFHTFPHRLHEIMTNPEYSEYITWLPNGYAWKILQRKQFESVAIPIHFRHGRFTSFMRQVRIKNTRSTNQCRYRF